MSNWTPPITTVGELIEHLQGFDPDQQIRAAIGYRERRIVRLAQSDDPRDGSTVYLFAESGGDPRPAWVDDLARGVQ